jgi:hypothetical protein
MPGCSWTTASPRATCNVQHPVSPAGWTMTGSFNHPSIQTPVHPTSLGPTTWTMYARSSVSTWLKLLKFSSRPYLPTPPPQTPLRIPAVPMLRSRPIRGDQLGGLRHQLLRKSLVPNLPSARQLYPQLSHTCIQSPLLLVLLLLRLLQLRQLLCVAVTAAVAVTLLFGLGCCCDCYVGCSCNCSGAPLARLVTPKASAGPET